MAATVTFIVVHGDVPEVYGGERSSVTTASALKRAGFRPRFLITADDALGMELLAEGLEYEVVAVGDPFAGLRGAPWSERLARIGAILRVNAAGFRAARERPAIIHASSGFRGYETALVGMALRDHLRIPLVYEVRSFFESTWTADHDRAVAALDRGGDVQIDVDLDKPAERVDGVKLDDVSRATA